MIRPTAGRVLALILARVGVGVELGRSRRMWASAIETMIACPWVSLSAWGLGVRYGADVERLWHSRPQP